MVPAPLVVFTYNRPGHTRRTIDALKRNSLAADSDLIVYSDAARTSSHQRAVAQVREYLATIAGFRSVTVRQRSHNFGLAESIIQGVSEVLREAERIIVLEDDMVTSPHFLTYMNEGLSRYSEDERVVSIHGYVYPVEQPLPEAFFLLGADCWGWATWRRGWTIFNPDGKYLSNELKRRNLVDGFDFHGEHPYSRMLEDQVAGMNDSWAIRWYASAYLAHKLTLYPGRSLVQNIGNDESGIHSASTTTLDVRLSKTPVDPKLALVDESIAARHAFEAYFRRRRLSLAGSLKGLVRTMFAARIRRKP